MSVGTAIKSTGQKLKTPSKAPSTPKVKSPKTPKGTPKASPAKTPKATPGKTPKATPGKTPIATQGKTPKATPGKTPKATPGKTPKATPGKTPKPQLVESPNAVQSPAFNMKSPGQKVKTPKNGIATPAKNTPKALGKSLNGTPMMTPNVQRVPKSAVTPKPTPKTVAAEAAQATPSKKTPKKRSASEAGLQKQQSSPGGKKGSGLGKIIPRHYRKLSEASKFGTAVNERVLKITNLPDEDEQTLTKTLLGLLKKQQGQIVEHKLENSGSFKQFSVQFKTYNAFLASKKLNGVLVGNRHILVGNGTDSFAYVNNKIVIDNLPHEINDEDVWKQFESCGNIYGIFRRRSRQYCVITFETNQGKQKALSSKKKIGKYLLNIKAFGDNKWWNVVYFTNLSQAVTEDDVQKFVKRIAPVENVKLFSASGCASVTFKDEQDVVKSFSLNGKELKGQKVELSVHAQFILDKMLPKTSSNDSEVDDDNDDDEDDSEDVEDEGDSEDVEDESDSEEVEDEEDDE